jgi:hypothetical protein
LASGGGKTTAADWQMKVILIILSVEIMLHFIQWGLSSSIPQTEIVESPGAIDILLGGVSWIAFADFPIPFPANALLMTVNAFCIITALFLLYINIRDWVWGL